MVVGIPSIRSSAVDVLPQKYRNIKIVFLLLAIFIVIISEVAFQIVLGCDIVIIVLPKTLPVTVRQIYLVCD